MGNQLTPSYNEFTRPTNERDTDYTNNWEHFYNTSGYSYTRSNIVASTKSFKSCQSRIIGPIAEVLSAKDKDDQDFLAKISDTSFK